MVLRALLLAAAAFAAAAPALADDGHGSRIGEAMRDPATQRVTSAAVGAMSEALLSIRVGPLLEAIETARGGPPGEIDPDLTLRDVAPEADAVPDEVSRRLPAMMGAMGGMAGVFEAALPQLREAAEAMRERIDGSLGD